MHHLVTPISINSVHLLAGDFFGSHKGFDPLNTEDRDELDHLNSDSDVEEYSATTHKA